MFDPVKVFGTAPPASMTGVRPASSSVAYQLRLAAQVRQYDDPHQQHGPLKSS